jgi:N-methylhydantoinase B
MNDVDRSNRRQQAVTRVDPITGAVIQGALENIAIEMGHKLMRMSYSSIIRESEDFGAALTDAEGRQLCECKMSTPLQSGPIPGYVRGIRRRLAARGDVFRPGDVIMHNDPYGGASHGPDVAFCVPVFDDDELLGFSVTTAHHLDIGAHTPAAAASSTRSTPMPKDYNSKRSRSSTRAAATKWCGKWCTITSASRIWLSAT